MTRGVLSAGFFRRARPRHGECSEPKRAARRELLGGFRRRRREQSRMSRFRHFLRLSPLLLVCWLPDAARCLVPMVMHHFKRFWRAGLSGRRCFRDDEPRVRCDILHGPGRPSSSSCTARSAAPLAAHERRAWLSYATRKLRRSADEWCASCARPPAERRWCVLAAHETPYLALASSPDCAFW